MVPEIISSPKYIQTHYSIFVLLFIYYMIKNTLL